MKWRWAPFVWLLALVGAPLTGLGAQVTDSVVVIVATAMRGKLEVGDSLTAYLYTRPRTLQSVTDVPAALGDAARGIFRWRRLPAFAIVGASTALLIASDEQVLDETRRFARRVDLPPNHPSVNLRIGPLKQPFPTTLGSSLYFLGDGMTSVLVATSFAARGSLADDTRARRTASEIIEALLATGAVTQVLKHVAGRQTPSEATVPRGRWRPFANLSDYNANVPAYDAFPSGHLASTMATVTVIARNYPEHTFIWPLGSAAMGVLSFAMVNNGVHWASDYPIALAIGGVIGDVVANRGRTLVRVSRTAQPIEAHTCDCSRFQLAPIVAPGMLGLRATW